jgi:uncharacterized protein YprB with RNaseH-like and TPR domain
MPEAVTNSESGAALPPGELVTTPAGEAYRLERRFPLTHQHGSTRLLELLDFDRDSDLTARVGGNRDLSQTSMAELAFVDTETTGLVGGAGSLVFLVGIGRFRGEEFVLRQYFLRDPVEEEPMLHALAGELEAVRGFVTFNGRAFDVPLLEMRYVMGLRQRLPLTSWPNLDLLHPSRRLWRRELPDCTLATLERQVLGVQRSGKDVAGAEVPGLYLDYLRSGDASEMERVLYHNEVDILSLVGLATEVLTRHKTPEPGSLSPSEALGLARWHETAGRISPAEAAYKVAAEAVDDGRMAAEALRHYSANLKRQRKYVEAVAEWERWHEIDPADPRPSLELAIYYEWRIKDLPRAMEWAARALASLERWPDGWKRRRESAAIRHRIARLQGKLSRGPSPA